MLSAMQPSWLLFFLFAAVLLAGCATLALRPTPPSPTETPLPTLISVPFTVSADLHKPPTNHYHFTPQVFINLPPITTSEPPGSIPIDVESPTCYNSPGGQICLGRIWNRTQNEITNLALSVRIAARPATPVTTAISQQLIASDAFAPYHLAIVGNRPLNDFTAQITHSSVNAGNFTRLAIRQHNGQLNAAGRFAINAILQNDNDSYVDHVQVVLTLFDEENSIIGYRISELEAAFPPQAEREITVEIIPLIDAASPSYAIHAEGRILRRGESTAAE